MPIKEPYGHGLPCNCYSRRVLLGLLPDPATYCPEICGTDIDIIGIYTGDPVSDGWYLRQDGGASADVAEIVYIESDTITDTIVCNSRLADYGHPNGENGGYEAPHMYSQGAEWFPLLEVLIKNNGSFDYEFTVFGTDEYDWAGSTTLIQYSTDGGTTWIDGGSSGSPTSGGDVITFNTGTDTFIYRTIVTLANGCQFYNPAPDTGNASYCIDYVTIDSSQTGGAVFDLLGTINGVTPLDDVSVFQPLIMATLAEPYQSVAGAYGGLGFQEGTGISGGFYMQVLRPSTESTTASIATILDAVGAGIDASPTGTNCEVKTYYGSFTPNDFSQLYVDGITLAGMQISFPEVQTPAINDQSEFLSRMEDRGLRDPAMAVVFTNVAPLDYSVTITTVLPIEAVIFDEVGVGQIIVNLTEI